MSFASEFKEFALKGNVVDLAVGVILLDGFHNIGLSDIRQNAHPVGQRATIRP